MEFVPHVPGALVLAVSYMAGLDLLATGYLNHMSDTRCSIPL